MNLDFLNNLINGLKESDFVQNFIQELGEYLEKNNVNKIENSKNEVSILEKIQKENNVTTEYRDKMYIERNNILENYANKTKSEGTMYYIYGKEGNNFLASICDKEKSHEVIKISKDELSKEIGVDSILRIKDGKYILDEQATLDVSKEMEVKFKELLEEQSRKMNQYRVEGHIYEFIEKTGESIWLIDNTANSNKAFQEFEYKNEVFEKAKEGDLFKYINGEYQKNKFM